MAIADDVSVATNGDIRYTGAGPNYSVLELHRFLQDLADDAQASGDDLVDITTDTPSDRSTDQIITLNSPFNVDDAMVRHLYDGSITQDDGDTVYSGLRVLGSVTGTTEIMIVQDHEVIPAFWGTGINPQGSDFVRILVKTRVGGADIDGKRIRVKAREFGDTYAEFDVTLGLANSVAAISTANDLNNATAAATVEGWTTIANVEGFQLIDIDGDGTPEEYYSQFDRGSQSLNDTYEWSKLQQARSLEEADEQGETGTDYTVDNATILGQGQSFTTGAVAQKLTEARFRLQVGGGAPTGPITAELYATTAGVIPTGGALATSDDVPAEIVTDRTTPTSYVEVIFRFNDNVTMSASTQYAIVVRHPNGNGTDFFEVEGAASGGVAGENKAEDTGSWAAQAGADLWHVVKATPIWHSQPGELFRGITTEVVYDNEAGGPFDEANDEILYWGTEVTYDGLSGSFVVGNYVQFQPSGGGTVKNGGKILADTGTVLTVALEDLSANLLDNDEILEIGPSSPASADVNGTPATGGANGQDLPGGEGILLALDDNGADGDLYYQLISGANPVDNQEIVGRTSGATALVNVTITSRTISPEFIGTSTGTNLIGAYGIGFQTTDVGASDLFFDLGNNPRTPPNNVTFTVTGLVSGEDRVLVGPRSGSSLVRNQLTTDTTLSGATETLVQCSTAIPTDTPASGAGADNTRLRVELDTGIYRRVQYDSYDTNDFTLNVADDDWTGANVSTTPKDVFVAYIDVLADATSEAYTAVYDSDRDLLVRVRDGGATPIKTFEGNGVFGSSDSSLAAIRQSDA